VLEGSEAMMNQEDIAYRCSQRVVEMLGGYHVSERAFGATKAAAFKIAGELTLYVPEYRLDIQEGEEVLVPGASYRGEEITVCCRPFVVCTVKKIAADKWDCRTQQATRAWVPQLPILATDNFLAVL
jgi:hypothetical protein